MPARLILLCSGTRGDVQPYLALGRRLRDAGYCVGVATHGAFQPMAAAAGLDFAPLDDSPNDLLLSDAYPGALALNRGVWRGLRSTVRFARASRPVYRRLWRSAWRACQGADGIIAGLPTSWGLHITQSLTARRRAAGGPAVPCLFAPLQPITRTRAFSAPVLPVALPEGSPLNPLTYRLLEWSMWRPLRGELNGWRAEMGLPALPPAGPFAGAYSEGVPFVYGFSPRVVPRPDDWPAAHRIAGYWFLDRPPDWRPPAALAGFLQEPGPVVFIGFGSWTHSQAPVSLELIAQATRQAGLRAVVSLDARSAAPPMLPPWLHRADDVPHDWLFPRMAAVAHHGGAGTTAAALRAGVPMLTLPAGVDQRFWGRRAAALGVAWPPLDRRHLTVDQLAGALRAAAGDGALREKARALGAAIAAEDGAGRAVALIQARVPPDRCTMGVLCAST